MAPARLPPTMDGALTANLAILAGLASLGFGGILALVGAASARRVDSSKLAWVSAGFFILGVQGGYFAWRVWQDRLGAADDVLVPAFLGVIALFTLYVAVYRRA